MTSEQVASYVYMLRDPREADRLKSIFYVGKGTGNRALQHSADALSELTDALKATDDIDIQKLLSAKIQTLQAITAENHDVLIDILAYAGGQGFTSELAFSIEAALIAVLDMTELGNKVRGHAIRLMPDNVFVTANEAELKPLPAGAAIMAVPVKGLWGGRDYAKTILGANEQQIWDNARQLWTKVASSKVNKIERCAGTNDPVVLLALAERPGKSGQNIVVGVFELKTARETKTMKGGHLNADGQTVPLYLGWEFVRTDVSHEDPSTTAMRNDLLGNTLTDIDSLPIVRRQNFGYLQGF